MMIIISLIYCYQRLQFWRANDRTVFFKESCEFFLYFESFCENHFNLVLGLFMNMPAK